MPNTATSQRTEIDLPGARPLRIVVTGFAVSFVGILPLGTVNVAATQIAIVDGLRAAVLFAAGAVVADVLYIYLTLRAVQWIQQRKNLFKLLEWLTLAVVLSLAAVNFWAAAHSSQQKNVLLSNNLPPFVLGLLLNGINPMQIPFWFGWSTVLMTKKVLAPRWPHYHLFCVGATAGMSAGILLFIFGGRLIADAISNNQSVVYLVIGGVFAVSAAVHAWKMIRKKDVESVG